MYERLITERNGIQEELNGLQLYLKAVGAIRRKRRGRPKKDEQTAPGVPSKKTQKAKPKVKRKKAAAKKKVRTAKLKKAVVTEQPHA